MTSNLDWNLRPQKSNVLTTCKMAIQVSEFIRTTSKWFIKSSQINRSRIHLIEEERNTCENEILYILKLVNSKAKFRCFMMLLKITIAILGYATIYSDRPLKKLRPAVRASRATLVSFFAECLGAAVDLAFFSQSVPCPFRRSPYVGVWTPQLWALSSFVRSVTLALLKSNQGVVRSFSEKKRKSSYLRTTVVRLTHLMLKLIY